MAGRGGRPPALAALPKPISYAPATAPPTAARSSILRSMGSIQSTNVDVGKRFPEVGRSAEAVVQRYVHAAAELLGDLQVVALEPGLGDPAAVQPVDDDAGLLDVLPPGRQLEVPAAVGGAHHVADHDPVALGDHVLEAGPLVGEGGRVPVQPVDER